MTKRTKYRMITERCFQVGEINYEIKHEMNTKQNELKL